MARRKKNKYRPKYPYTRFSEALDMYKVEVLKDEVTRNNFLVHIQPLVERCTKRIAGLSGKCVSGKMDDVIGFVNVKLLESWLPRYFSSKPKSNDIPSAVSYLITSIRGYVKKFIVKNYDTRIVPAYIMEARSQSRSSVRPKEEVEFGATFERMLAEHVALRPRPDLDVEVVEKLMRHLALKECSGDK